MTEGTSAIVPSWETPEMQKFRKDVQLKYAAFTLENCMRSLRHIYRRTHDMSREAISLTDDQVQRVMRAASRGIREPERNYAIVATLFGTGVRLGELAGIKLANIRADVLTVTGKGQNTLGMLLMELRDELKKEANEE